MVNYPELNNELHVKLCADHGGKSFKACYQVINRNRPNNKDNTVIFSMFEAKDLRTNLRTGLGRFGPQVNQLQSSTWKYDFYSPSNLKQDSFQNY